LPIILDEETVSKLQDSAENTLSFAIDLENQSISFVENNEKKEISFDIDPEKKERLLKGFDDISLTLEKTEKISGFEIKQKKN
jgi:3-isopropylmalate/(R)-2-methylmalate dehydratase small subunit